MRARWRGRDLRVLSLAALVAVAAACGSGVSNVSPTPAASVAAATSFAEYAVGFCSAFQALFRAVGNPDTGSGSTLSNGLDDAVATGDVASADRLAAEIRNELEAGRRHVAFASGWLPATPMMAHLDRLFVAFEAMAAAKRTLASQAPGSPDPQTVFEQAGGLDAWQRLLQAWPALESERPDGVQPCAEVPISP